MSEPTPTLELRRVSAQLGTKTVLSNITVSAAPGDLVAIVGPNGAGKTTLLRLIAGLLSPSMGEVVTLGCAPGNHRRDKLARLLSYVPQNYQLAFPFSVREVVLMGRYPQRRGPWLDDEADEAAAAAAMQRFELGDLSHRRFDELSGGEQRRVLLAQSACQGAKVCLFDEPTAALDPAHARAVFQGLATMATEQAATVVVVTHDLNLAVQHATSLWVLAAGQLVARGTPSDVLEQGTLGEAFAVDLHVGKLPSGAPFVVMA